MSAVQEMYAGPVVDQCWRIIISTEENTIQNIQRWYSVCRKIKKHEGNYLLIDHKDIKFQNTAFKEWKSGKQLKDGPESWLLMLHRITHAAQQRLIDGDRRELIFAQFQCILVRIFPKSPKSSLPKLQLGRLKQYMCVYIYFC